MAKKRMAPKRPVNKKKAWRDFQKFFGCLLGAQSLEPQEEGEPPRLSMPRLARHLLGAGAYTAAFFSLLGLGIGNGVRLRNGGFDPLTLLVCALVLAALGAWYFFIARKENKVFQKTRLSPLLSFISFQYVLSLLFGLLLWAVLQYWLIGCLGGVVLFLGIYLLGSKKWITEQKTVYHTWFAVIFGCTALFVLLIALDGSSKNWVLSIIEVFVSLGFFAAHLSYLRKASKSPEVKALVQGYGLVAFTAAQTLLAALLGLLLSAAFWRVTGDWMLSSVESQVRKGGYDFSLPASSPKDPGPLNGVTWLNLAQGDKALGDLEPVLGKSPDKFMDDFLLRASQGKVRRDGLDKIAQALKKCGRPLNWMNQASQCQALNWGIDFTKPWYEVECPSLAHLIPLSRLLACEVVLESREGNPDKALAALRAGFYMANAAVQTHELIGCAVGVAVQNRMLQAVQCVERSSSLSQTAKGLKPFLARDGFIPPLRQTIENEIFLGGRYAGLMSFPESVKFSGDPEASDIGGLTDFYWPFLGWDAASYMNSFGLKAEQAFTLPYLKMKGAFDQADASVSKNGWFLAQIAAPKFFTIYSKDLVNTALNRLAYASIAARQYRAVWKKWPSRPGDIKTLVADAGGVMDDPFAEGGPLKFVGKDGHFFIYSIGPDGVDDLGKTDYMQTKDKGDILWWMD